MLRGRGSHIIAERPNQPDVLLRLGCLDTPITNRPKLHMWRSEGACWYNPATPCPNFPRRRRLDWRHPASRSAGHRSPLSAQPLVRGSREHR